MARLWSCGFELQSVTNGVEITGKTGTTPTINTTIKRSGSAALRCTPTTNSSYINTQFTASNFLIKVRFAIYIASLPSATTQVCIVDQSVYDYLGAIKLTTTGTLQLWSVTTAFPSTAAQIGSDSAALSTGAWHVVTFSMDTTTASSWPCTAAVDGTTFVNTTFTGSADSAFNIDRLFVGPFDTTTTDLYFDDIAVNDSSGTSETGLPDWKGQIIHLQPNAAGDNNAFTVQTGGTAGSANNYTRVDEITPDDSTSYNGDVTAGDIDDFNITNTPASIGSGDTINVVSIGVRYNAAVASLEAAFKVRVKKASAGTVTLSAAITPNATTWKTNNNATVGIYPLVTYKDPDASVWTKATLDTAQIGYTISTTNTNAANISAVWMLVDSTPAAGPSPSSSIGGTLSMLGVG